jgi:hypothetical protein
MRLMEYFADPMVASNGATLAHGCTSNRTINPLRCFSPFPSNFWKKLALFFFTVSLA